MIKEISKTKDSKSRSAQLKENDAVQSASDIGRSSYIAMQPIHTVQFTKKNETGLPDKLKAGVENLSGYSLDDVRVHYNSDKPQTVQALAYTQGDDIYVGPGQEKHLPHEAWHVVQQKEGRVKPTLQLKGIQVNDDKGLEHEADVMGERALRQSTAGDERDLLVNNLTEETLQRKHIDEQPKVQVNKRYKVKVEKGKSNRPILVFETFGDNAEQLAEIYKQSCQYQGRTVCVLGINCRETEDNLQDRVTALQRLLKGNIHAHHSVYIIPFKWSPTELSGGYDMPYMEIRGMLMKEAETIVSEIVGNVLFRWIDRDVTGDTSVALDPYSWSLLYGENFDKEKVVLTGVYRWLSKSDNSDFYLDFIEEINDTEREIRKHFFALVEKYKIRYMLTNDPPFKPTFYLPEPILYITRTAHQAAITQCSNITGNMPQSQESLRAFLQAGDVPKVEFYEELSVRKPIKNEGTENSYLSGLEAMWRSREKYSLEDFYAELKKIRQSAFDNKFWNFTNDGDSGMWEKGKDALRGLSGDVVEFQGRWNEYRLTYAKYLYDVYCELHR